MVWTEIPPKESSEICLYASGRKVNCYQSGRRRFWPSCDISATKLPPRSEVRKHPLDCRKVVPCQLLGKERPGRQLFLRPHSGARSQHEELEAVSAYSMLRRRALSRHSDSAFFSKFLRLSPGRIRARGRQIPGLGMIGSERSERAFPTIAGRARQRRPGAPRLTGGESGREVRFRPRTRERQP
jgi:hypothetical protein